MLKSEPYEKTSKHLPEAPTYTMILAPQITTVHHLMPNLSLNVLKSGEMTATAQRSSLN